MECCALGSLKDVTDILHRPLQESQIAFVCHSVLRGLQYLHNMKKIHRDIKSGTPLVYFISPHRKYTAHRNRRSQVG